MVSCKFMNRWLTPDFGIGNFLEDFYYLPPALCEYSCEPGYYPNPEQPLVACDLGLWIVKADDMFVKWQFDSVTKALVKVLPPATGQQASCKAKSCTE